MKVLVTGTAGFIGSHVALRLLERSDDVIGLDSLNDRIPSAVASPAAFPTSVSYVFPSQQPLSESARCCTLLHVELGADVLHGSKAAVNTSGRGVDS